MQELPGPLPGCKKFQIFEPESLLSTMFVSLHFFFAFEGKEVDWLGRK